MRNIGTDLYAVQLLGETSPIFWATKAVILLFDSGELVGKQGKMEIYTVSENGKHSVFAWVEVGLNDGRDLFLGTTNVPVNANEVLDVWL